MDFDYALSHENLKQIVLVLSAVTIMLAVVLFSGIAKKILTFIFYLTLCFSIITIFLWVNQHTHWVEIPLIQQIEDQLD
ncbi:MAG: hypothetical protein MK193_01140 [Lentisphaeria bacterium]|nr:hypothetical protein [Lentisphaeria bacterium]